MKISKNLKKILFISIIIFIIFIIIYLNYSFNNENFYVDEEIKPLRLTPDKIPIFNVDINNNKNNPASDIPFYYIDGTTDETTSKNLILKKIMNKFPAGYRERIDNKENLYTINYLCDTLKKNQLDICKYYKKNKDNKSIKFATLYYDDGAAKPNYNKILLPDSESTSKLLDICEMKYLDADKNPKTAKTEKKNISNEGTIIKCQ
jgi:hypothetical protein